MSLDVTDIGNQMLLGFSTTISGVVLIFNKDLRPPLNVQQETKPSPRLEHLQTLKKAICSELLVKDLSEELRQLFTDYRPQMYTPQEESSAYVETLAAILEKANSVGEEDLYIIPVPTAVKNFLCLRSWLMLVNDKLSLRNLEKSTDALIYFGCKYNYLKVIPSKKGSTDICVYHGNELLFNRKQFSEGLKNTLLREFLRGVLEKRVKEIERAILQQEIAKKVKKQLRHQPSVVNFSTPTIKKKKTVDIY